MRRILFALVFLLIALSGCEYANSSFPEKVCIKAENLTIVNNASGIYVANGQMEVELNGCDFNEI